MNKIVHIRFSNGDELMGELVKNNWFSVTIKNPMSIDEKGLENGKSMIYLSRYIIGNEQTVKIWKYNILIMTGCHEEFERYYRNSVKMAEAYIDKEILSAIAQANDSIESQETIDEIMEQRKGSETTKNYGTLH